MTFNETLTKIEQQAVDLVWWKPEQIERGEHLVNDPKKGERSWIIPRTTGEFLRDLVLQEKPKVILELGTSIGYSTLWLAHAAREYSGHVYTIEKQEKKCVIAKENVSEVGLQDSVTFINAEIAPTLDGLGSMLGDKKINFLFMDADRGHYHKYLKQLENFLSKDCTIIADNAINMQARMKPFLDALSAQGWKYEILELDNGILLARKINL